MQQVFQKVFLKWFNPVTKSNTPLLPANSEYTHETNFESKLPPEVQNTTQL